MKYLSVLLLLNACLVYALYSWHFAFTVSALDIGQGDAILLSTPEQHHILIDGGEGNFVLREIGGVMSPVFKEIDLLVLTHPHRDHMEGLIEVLRRFKVRNILLSAPHHDSEVYEAFLEAVNIETANGANLYFASSGMKFIIGELEIIVLSPEKVLTGKDMSNVNNASPVLRVEYQKAAGSQKATIILTGDAEQEVEAELLLKYAENPEILQADILKAGHHGSRTSSTAEFLAAVNPDHILISSGENNSFGHPHPETLTKATEMDIEIHRTDIDGRVTLSFFECWLPGPSTFVQKLRNRDQCN